MKLPYILVMFFCLLMNADAVGQLASPVLEKERGVQQSQADALAIADEVMRAMGGQKAWDNTHFIHWNFFGRRSLLWDKWGGKARIDIPEQKDTYILNLHTGEGQIWLNEQSQTHPDTLAKYLQRAKSIWINDSYWLVMPFKLRDAGVTLKLLDEETIDSRPQHILQLTFEEVGETPENKYEVCVDQETKLVSEWRYYAHFNDAEPRFSMPWLDYERYGEILLSGNRGQRQLGEIAVYYQLPAAVFTQREMPDLTNWR